MKRAFAALFAPMLLVACGGGTSPLFTLEEQGDQQIDPTDPNVSVNSKFLFNVQERLTMNSVQYDAANDELVINNLPFDGPTQRYDRIGQRNGARFYASRKTETTGQIQHYAVFVQRDALEATAAAGAEWREFGFGGANINRNSFNLPASGEYIYTGVYAGVRTLSDRTGLHLVTGDAELLLDIDDLDPNGTIQGSIVGNVTNRTRSLPDGTPLANLPPIFLQRVSFDAADGTFDGGTASTFDLDGDPRATGSYEGLIGGPLGEELGTISVLTGTAEEQRVSFEVVEFEVPAADPNDPPQQSGTIRALTNDNAEAIQLQVDGGFDVPLLTVPDAALPAGAIVTSRTVETQDFTSDFDAREIGVIGADQVIPTDPNNP